MIIQFSHANWGTPGSGQYHIQTDEGPERFFRYQTDNGQFRKEKRLKDGTVIGTNAWIDGFGYLRQNDYIADHAGYRILKSKTVFVGKDKHIQDAMKESKKVPATSGVLVPSSSQSPAILPYIPPSTTISPISSNIPYSTPGHYHNKVPAVVIRPHAYPSDKFNPNLKFNSLDQQPVISITSNDISSIQTPSIYYQPPYEASSNENEHSLPPIVVLSTPAPSSDNDDSNSSPVVTNNQQVEDESHLPPLAYYPSSTTVKPLVKDESHLPPIAFYSSSTENSLDYNSVIPLASSPVSSTVKSLNNELLPPKDDSYDAIVSITSRPRLTSHYETSTSRTIVDYDRNTIETAESHLSPTYRDHQQRENNVPLFDRSKYQKTPYYDGVGVTANGFRYFLPRQYQEEVENKNEGSRDGSFGYIDPFGIRRVIYYNAGKNGFIHRKNNRYVGFNSTPYDPRPN
ncbi:hypothetical protein PVAND_006213 [Polypedilum vanderplanki]|uniref:Cuticle protein n=1 Tax=Polypedilum vanderplanki TaxID=319348 RepID=A0A9J6C2G4_POLVA|nr:hypothetical protein PVAND_006213 [Polypedilum vanderplanki]